MEIVTKNADIRDLAADNCEVVEPEVVDEEGAKESVFESLDREKQKEILKIQLEIEQCLITVKVCIYEIGKLLARSKDILPHGEFQRWIEETWKHELPYSTAAHYLRIFRKFEGRPGLVRRLPLTFLQQLSQERFPGEVLKLVKENPESVDEKAVRDISEAYGAYKKGVIKYQEFETLTKSLLDLGMQILEGETLVRHSVLAKRTISVGIGDLKLTIRRIRRHSHKLLEIFLPAWECEVKKEALRELCDKDVLKDVDSAIGELEALKKLIVEGAHGPFFREKLAVKEGIVVKTLEPVGEEPNAALEPAVEGPKLLSEKL
jgi:hypothetical protein